jgi:hypothetical protein
MIVRVYVFLSNVNKSSVNVFITTMNSSDTKASTCTIKYFNEASVLHMFLTLDIRGINDIRLSMEFQIIHDTNRQRHW